MLLLILKKYILFFYFLYFFYEFFFIFSCSGMFRDVPECSMFWVLSTAFLKFYELRIKLDTRSDHCLKSYKRA